MAARANTPLTLDERELLVDLVHENSVKKGVAKDIVTRRQVIWEKVTEKFNTSLSHVEPRTKKQLRTAWKRMKDMVQRKAKRRNAEKTKGCRSPPYEELRAEIMRVIKAQQKMTNITLCNLAPSSDATNTLQKSPTGPPVPTLDMQRLPSGTSTAVPAPAAAPPPVAPSLQPRPVPTTVTTSHVPYAVPPIPVRTTLSIAPYVLPTPSPSYTSTSFTPSGSTPTAATSLSVVWSQTSTSIISPTSLDSKPFSLSKTSHREQDAGRNRGKKKKSCCSEGKSSKRMRRHEELTEELLKLVQDSSVAVLKVGQAVQDVCNVMSEQVARLTERALMVYQAINKTIDQN
ncbi:uncharacterized protein [Panulirus ornatus]|uniref:uncharacterized protein n=1 Tax=Panulirus ornatus TaxID=150431 RepID=UPI003A866C8B